MRRRSAIALLCAVVAGCGGSSGGRVDGGGGGGDAAPADAAPPTGCPRSPAAADRARKIVISHPYDSTGAQAPTYEVLDLSTDGTLSQPGTTFEMGRSFNARIHFTPDGEIGIVAQDDGTLGEFRLNGDTPEVLEAGYDAGGAFYASDVVMAADGAHFWVLDSQWRTNGGGIDQVAINCDGSLSYEGEVAPAKLAYAMALVPGTSKAVVAADDIRDSTAGDTAHLVDLAGTGVIAGADAFGDTEALVSDAALTSDGRYFLIADNNEYYDTAGLMNRIAVVQVGADSLDPVQVLTPINDPFAIVTSPSGDGAIAVSGYGNAIFEIDYSAGAQPFTIAGELTYTGAKPQLPGKAVMVARGSLRGLVLVAELQGVRRVRFAAGGTVEDDGVTLVGSGNESIVGSIGVQP